MSTNHLRAPICLLVTTLAACVFSGGSGRDADDSDPTRPTDPSDPNTPSNPGTPFDECAAGDLTSGSLGGEEVCLASTGDPGPPLVVVEHVFEDHQGTSSVHIRLTFNPTFNDNTYGIGSVGWGNKAHKFSELIGSDHARLFLYDSAGELIYNLKLDYISEDPSAACGYASLGPFGGDGRVDLGDPNSILDWSTSLDENLNARGYCLTTDSPVTNSRCDPSPSAPNWDFRVVYDLWIATAAFGAAGFGVGDMESVHASPSKGESTVDVDPVDCPEDNPNGCLDPDGCPGDNPCGGVECGDDSVCNDGVCVPVIE